MERNSEEVAILVAQSGPLNGQRWSLKNSIMVGRDPECEIVIPDRQVSRNHVRFIQTKQGVFVEDLESKNGTYLNGQVLVTKQLLQDGDVLQVALAQKFIFLSSDATLPLDSDYHDLQTEYLISRSAQPQSAGGDSSMMDQSGRLRLDKRSRRVYITISNQGPKTAPGKTTSKEIEIDPPLSASQFRLLELLFEQQGQVVSRQELVRGIWGIEEAIGVSEQALDALIRRLRDRLASHDPTHNYIVTVRGHGLRLDNPA